MFLGIYQGTPFLGIYRETCSSEFPDENSEEHFVGTSEDWTIGKSIEISRGSSPSVYSEEISDEQVVLGISSEICFLGIPSENSEGFLRKIEFPRTCFVVEVQTTSNKSSRLLRGSLPDDFQEVVWTSRKSSGLPGSRLDFQEVVWTSWKSFGLHGSLLTKYPFHNRSERFGF
ncbi:hypothetical protein F2Q69_00055116 [Brassica cretica]|uniref:Uncharacterized protein n=1 Tax=Brassica cretica TaxID=69181 RepID=A0A8S9MRP7_BRACR|nr:hypothetical protein F2Q69_00055116 [Brassica cretica]